MQNQTKVLILFILSVFILYPFFTSARSGCCSHHGGVCGCGCCDGTSLSATCAPYYPQCNGGQNANPAPYNPPPANNNDNPNVIPPVFNNQSNTGENNDNSALYGLAGLVFGGGIIYYYIKHKNKTQ